VEARQDIEILRSKGCKPNEKGHRKKTYKYLRKSMDGSKEIQDETSASHQILGFLQIFSSSNSEIYTYDI